MLMGVKVLIRPMLFVECRNDILLLITVIDFRAYFHCVSKGFIGSHQIPEVAHTACADRMDENRL